MGSRIPLSSQLKTGTTPKSRPLKRGMTTTGLEKNVDEKKSKLDTLGNSKTPASHLSRANVTSRLNEVAVVPNNGGFKIPILPQTKSASKRGMPATIAPGRTASRTGGRVESSQETKALQVTSTTKPAGKPKRPVWDLRGRVEDMETAAKIEKTKSSELEKKVSDSEERLALLESMNDILKYNVQEKETLSKSAQDEVDALKLKMRELEADITSLQKDKERDSQEILIKNVELGNLKVAVANLTTSQVQYKALVDSTKLLLQKETATAIQQNVQLEELRKILERRDAEIAILNEKQQKEEQTRRKLHNVIQELKGNIRVFCRLRPPLKSESTLIPHITIGSDTTIELEKASASTKYPFAFDRVFGPQDNQNIVFMAVSELVQSALDGFNVCVFAYGQTGSGKTYTMEGGVAGTDQEGVIPRTVSQIFKTCEDLKSKGWTYNLDASFLEIYNEQIRDLLASRKENQETSHEIKQVTGQKEVYVTNLHVQTVTDDQQVKQLLELASKQRAVATTKCNEYSSRSHSVFQLKINGKNEITTEACQATLSLIDLAGSERLKESGSEGERLEEAKKINLSLSNLGNVIMAIAQKKEHVPYRNSKLTYLLRDSLGGNSKTLMLVNISPEEEYFNETINSLRFATKVNQCQIGTATKRVK